MVGWVRAALSFVHKRAFVLLTLAASFVFIGLGAYGWLSFANYQSEHAAQQLAVVDDSGNRDRYDLRAQQDMAEWAYSLLWVGVANLVVTAVGVIYVGLTLRQTQVASAAAVTAAEAAVSANERFTEASHRELRPYLSATPTDISIDRVGDKDDPKKILVKVKLTLKNHGQTPAYRSRLAGHISLMDWPPHEGFWREFPEKLMSDRVFQPGETGEMSVMQIVKFDRAQLTGDKKRLLVSVIVRYQDAFGVDHYVRACSSALNLGIWWDRAVKGSVEKLVLEHFPIPEQAD